MKTERIEEFKLSRQLRSTIANLLRDCFRGYPEGYSCYHQLPNFRYLVWSKDKLIGHMAVIHRLINNAGRRVSIFGISDLCVATDYQHRKIASSLLERLNALGEQWNIDFLLLLAKDHELYEAHGFELVELDGRWLIISNSRSLGLARRRLPGTLMVKPLGDKKWQDGEIDFLGHLF
ncbi:MAG: GNAT family N-acetyltransferase [Saprospiraceae bacterium]|nr:GNAT family N-acetyltransferase [Saprospiraceae bacterium]